MADPQSDGGVTRRKFVRTSAAGVGGAALLGGGVAFALSRDGDRATVSEDPPPAIRRPGEALNLVVINLDSVRADHLGCYRADRHRPARAVRTPSIDALARESLRFTHARPEVLPTGPTRRSTYTGIRTFPFRDWRPAPDSPRIYGWMPIPERQVQVDEVLRAKGYRTALVTDNTWLLKGSWERFREGFDDLRTIANQEHQNLRPGTRTKRISLADYVPRGLRERAADEKRVAAHLKVVERYMSHTRTFRQEDDWFSPRVFRQAISWLDEQVAKRATEPFALFVECYDPHEPWDPPKKYVDLYDDPDYRGIEPVQPFYGRADYLTERQIERQRALYAGELTMTDKWLGDFLDRLEHHDLLDRTVVVLWSDHGISIDERGYLGKNPSQLYSEMVDVPLLIRHPEGRMAGRTTDYLAQLHDLPSTALAMLGIAAPKANQGHDLAPLFYGERVQRREVQVAGYNDNVFAGDERWTYIDSNRFRNPKLFDRRADPGERRNVASDHGDVVDRMRAAIRQAAGNREIPRYGPDFK
jgi:arylsulfatase A-like enzyme